ncbi:hypothetical protein [Campylobacter fetus]|uniref:hypothetical protein n=1 Tax=Campylobacter fetus TaxID=196 RepID=UPI000CFCF5C1|nr:hypothetical protein [Campylobacter fetus]AVK80632.1 hypothetical protein C6B32_01875 [Campylobacter fetus subsp. testudinum]
MTTRDRQAKNLSNLTEILMDLNEMIEDLKEALDAEDNEELYNRADTLVEHYIKTKRKFNLY